MRRTNSSNIEGLCRRGHGLRWFNPVLCTGMRFSGRETLRMAAVAVFLVAFGLSTFLISARGDDAPLITGIVRTNSANCLICYTNCNDTNFDYFVQSSTNLVDWVGTTAVLQGATTNTTVICPVFESGNQCFHRVGRKPHINGPLFGLVPVGTIHLNGSNVIFDSFDPSGTNTGGFNISTNIPIAGIVRSTNTLPHFTIHFDEALATGNSSNPSGTNTGGLYNPTNQITGDPGTNFVPHSSIGNADISGKLQTGP